jgi:hypothetical protein
MSIAARIDPVLDGRQAKAAARAAERAARDAFIQAAFPPLIDRFAALLGAALGIDSRLALTATPVTLAVQGRSFATLNSRDFAAQASFNAAPRMVRFSPRLDFRAPDQFGLIECALDFPYVALRSRADSLAQALLGRGIQLRGKTSASLLLPLAGGLVEVSADMLEDAFHVWWLRS